jgi:phage terminase small subunit
VCAVAVGSFSGVAMEQTEIFPGNRIERARQIVNASLDRKARFVSAYLENGFNATEAAKTAGFSEKTAYSQGARLLKNVEISRAISKGAAKLIEDLDYSAARTLKEVARVAFVDPRKLFNADGTAKKIDELDDGTAAAVSSFELGEGGKLMKVKLNDKNAAHDKLMRYHSLYKDKSEMTVGGEFTLVVDL